MCQNLQFIIKIRFTMFCLNQLLIIGIDTQLIKDGYTNKVKKKWKLLTTDKFRKITIFFFKSYNKNLNEFIQDFYD